MSITKKRLFLSWLPLAIMWLVMAVDQPMITSFISRLPDATNELAAFGFSFALALFIEGPVVQMLSAGTAVTESVSSYKKILKIMHWLAFITGAAHLLFCIPAVFEFTAVRLLSLPEELLNSAYWCFVLMLPWSPTIGYRRLWQGIMIKQNRSKYVPIVMYVRIILAFVVLFIGLKMGNIRGALLSGITLSVGAISGMVTAYILVKPALKKLPATDKENLTLNEMVKFYIPLAITSWITLGIRPLMNLGITKGLDPVASLAVWPVVLAYFHLYNSVSQSVQEIAIAEYKKENLKAIKSFVNIVALSLSALYLIVYLIKPLWQLWFVNVSHLPQGLLVYLPLSLGLLAVLPYLSAKIAYYRAILVSERQTPSITIGIFINVATLVLGIMLLPIIFEISGVYIATAAYTLSFIFEIIYLSIRVIHLRKLNYIF